MNTPQMRRVLKEHYLTAIICDEVAKDDKPVCQCSLVDLGWHPSVGEAVDAWLDHVFDQFDESLGRRPE